MIRAVLTIIVAVALVGTALPALEANRTSTTVDRLETQAVALERAIAAVAADSVAVDDPTLAAGTTVRVTAPTGLTATRIDRLVIADPTDVITDPADATTDPTDATTDPTDATTDPTDAITAPAAVSQPTDEIDPTNDSHTLPEHSNTPDVAIVYWLSDGPRVVQITPTVRTGTVDVDSPIELRPGGTTRLRIRLVNDAAGPTLTLTRAG